MIPQESTKQTWL